jgi:hypothetical protein
MKTKEAPKKNMRLGKENSPEHLISPAVPIPASQMD